MTSTKPKFCDVSPNQLHPVDQALSSSMGNDLIDETTPNLKTATAKSAPTAYRSENLVDTSCTKLIAKVDSPLVEYRPQKQLIDNTPIQIDTRAVKHP